MIVTSKKFSRSKRTSGESEQHGKSKRFDCCWIKYSSVFIYVGWTSTGSMKHAREFHTSSVLSNGKVLVVSGAKGDNAIRSSELYNPSTHTWTTAGNLKHPRYFHTASALLDGKQLVTGGGNNDDDILNSAELFDPTTENWTTIQHMHEPRAFHAALTLSNGKVLIIGGANGTNISRSAELYDPSTGNWTFTGSMVSPRELPTASILPNGKVLVAGGSPDDSTMLNTCELYDPSTGLWTATGSMNQERIFHVAVTLLNGKVLVIGGGVGNQHLIGLNSTELYDPLTGVWTTTGSMKYPRMLHTASLLPDGNVLVVGGTDNETNRNIYNSSELYNSSTGVWLDAGDMLISRAGHTASLLNNRNVLISGGGGTNWTALRSAELYVPSTNSFTASDINNTLQLSDKSFI